MSMFEKYDKLNPDYIPDNTSPRPMYTYETLDESIPKVAYNAKGFPIGYEWTHGDEFQLTLSANRNINVAEDSIVYSTKGESPQYSTEGHIGQQAYNTIDCISWTCVGVSSGHYIWVKDDDFIYALQGTKNITLAPDMTDKSTTLIIYNFRWEPIYTLAKTGSADICFKVDKDINEQLKPGVYYSILKITSDNSSEVVDKQLLIVK